MFVLVAMMALAGAAVMWGVDSRDDPSRNRPRRWFIETDGRAMTNADRHLRRGRLHRPALSRESGGGLPARRTGPAGVDAAGGGRDESSHDGVPGSEQRRVQPSLVHAEAGG